VLKPSAHADDTRLPTGTHTLVGRRSNVANVHQRLGVTYVLIAVVAAIVSAIAFPAKTVSDRVLHALFAICAVGVVLSLVLLVVVPLIGAKEKGKSQDEPH
jgi:Na+-transporting NADH:ubiquinone oxidoreductase subunit NqrE